MRLCKILYLNFKFRLVLVYKQITINYFRFMYFSLVEPHFMHWILILNHMSIPHRKTVSYGYMNIFFSSRALNLYIHIVHKKESVVCCTNSSMHKHTYIYTYTIHPLIRKKKNIVLKSLYLWETSAQRPYLACINWFFVSSSMYVYLYCI